MKKIVIASLFALVASMASAVEIGIIGGELFNANKNASNTAGLTISESFGKFGLTAEADHNFSKKVATNANRYSLIGSYDLAKVGNAKIAAKAGVDYLSQRGGSNLSAGYGLIAGVGVSLPITKVVNATFDYRYNAGQVRVQAENGNQFLVGVKYAF